MILLDVFSQIWTLTLTRRVSETLRGAELLHHESCLGQWLSRDLVPLASAGLELSLARFV